MMTRHCSKGLGAALVLLVCAAPVAAQPFRSSDLSRISSVGDVQLSPDGTHIAYTVQRNDRPGRPYSEVWILETSSGRSRRLGSDENGASGPRWSPDGQSVAFFGRDGDRRGLLIARADGSDVRFVAPVESTNHPLPSAGERLTWSPDGRQLAYISATPGPEVDANGDPMVITRYLYKPTASEGLTRFNDNKRLHIFVADVASHQVRQLTDGNYYEHSIDWSPQGNEIVFVSNRGPDPDRFFNYDLFAVAVKDGAVRRLTDTKSAEYRPVWSPDGKSITYLATTRPLTSSETTMEDTHVWVMEGSGRNARELGREPDNRQGAPQWAQDGTAIYASVQQQGSVALYRFAVAGGSPQAVITDRGSLGSWSIGKDGAIAYAFNAPDRPSELYMRKGAAGSAQRLTDLNAELMKERRVASVESLRFKSFDGQEVEAFLTLPLELDRTRKHPMIVMIHGGPHGQQGPAFNHKAQVYAGQGWASLMVNYRGSTGYGQKFADAIFKDQNGGEAKDVVAAVDAAIAKHSWIDPSKLGIEGGSYGGQLTNWIITQTDRFAAAVPAAGIANLVSFNYMAYYHDYLAVEFGAFPHENGLMDLLWERSPIRYVHKVKTPVMFVHGENDNDVPIAEAEQYFIALKDVGVETVMIRYPREGHGVRETQHVIDIIDRSMAWYQRHFAEGRPSAQ